MSPVTLAELDPVTRQRVLDQIETTEGVSASPTNTDPQRRMLPALVASLMPVTVLKAHPLSVRVYGEPTASEELLRSIREIGVVQPIVIDRGNLILAGTSRHFAAVQAGQTEIPAVLFNGSAIEGEWLVLESNRQRVKLASQIGREYLERLRLESEFAKLRMVQGGKNKGTPIVAEAGDARDKAAKAVHLGRTTAERLARVVVKADAGQVTARKLLAAVDAGETSITAAFRELELSKPIVKPVDCPVCHEPFHSMTILKRHAHNVHGLEATPLKEAMGFENKERDPRHNQVSPYADKSRCAGCLQQNALGWTSALDSIRRLTDIADKNKSLLMNIKNVLGYVTANTTNGVGQSTADGSGWHFRTQQEWDIVEELISTLNTTVNTLTSNLKDLQQARNIHREQFLDVNALPSECPTGKRIYPTVAEIRKAGAKGKLPTFGCRECGGVHIGSEYQLTAADAVKMP